MKYLLSILFVSLSLANFSQEEVIEPKKNLQDGNVSEQFDYIITESGKYQEYKVVKKTWLNTIRRNVVDTVANLKNSIISLKNEIKSRDNTISGINNDLGAAKLSLTSTQSEKDSIDFFGKPTLKSTYKTIMWGLVIGLTLLTLVFIIRSMQRGSLKNEAKNALKDVQEQYDQHVKRSLEREQKLMRDLQDERNNNI